MKKTLMIVVLIVLAIFIYAETRPAIAPTDTNTNTGETPGETARKVGEVKIALLDTEGNSTGKSRGCDKVAMISRTITPTSAPLTAAMNELFGLKDTNVGGLYNFIAKTSSTLKFDHAVVEDSTAKIYLTGSLSGLSGVCDDPRAAIQIEETALEFATVDNVEIYLNGIKTTLVPSEK
jgi:hypothetical protein